MMSKNHPQRGDERMTKEERCCEMVTSHDGLRIDHHQCNRRGVIEENGKRYCKQHAPSNVAAKRQEQDAQCEARWAAQRLASKRRQAEIDACCGVPTEQLSPGCLSAKDEEIKRLREALEKINGIDRRCKHDDEASSA